MRFRMVFGLAAAALLGLASVRPGSTAVAAPAESDAARKQATERLFNAVYANDYSAVQASVGAGADVEATNSWGITAADLAVDKGYFRIAHYLVSVRNFQRKPDQAAAPAASGVGNEAVKSASGQPETAHPGASTKPVTPVKAPAATAPTPTPLPAPAPAPMTTTARMAVPTRDVSAVEDAVNPFDPKAPAYGAQVPAVQN